MVERKDLFHLPFYEKEAFTGSDRGIRFWIGKKEPPLGGSGREAVLRAIVWPEPYALKFTDDALKTAKDFSFSEEGLDFAYAWIMSEGREAALAAKAG